jgi:hypothetical protein
VRALKENHSPSNIKFDSEEIDIVLEQAAARLYRIQ